MAAPSIPSLTGLRGRSGLRGRGRGRGRGPGQNDPESEEDKAMARDHIVQQTDGDASSSRMSAVALGYLDDEYSRAFIQGQIPRRYPIINRGTFVRTTAIDRLVERFLQTDPEEKKQIVSLGAGSDTRFFRLGKVESLVYHEVDFPTNTAQKIAAIERTPALLELIHSAGGPNPEVRISPEKSALTSAAYHVHPLDLRSLAPSSSSDGTAVTPSIPNLDPSVPTLLISECCLCYLDPGMTSQILHCITETLLPEPTPIALVLYEPVRPYDPFGRTMVTNLASRGIHLQTLKKYYSLAAQRLRLANAGFTAGQGARDVEAIYYGDKDESWITAEERRRIEGLEWLDEVEEWRLLASHYCVAWGWRNYSEPDGKHGIFDRAWEGVRGQWTEKESRDVEMV